MLWCYPAQFKMVQLEHSGILPMGVVGKLPDSAQGPLPLFPRVT